MALAALFLLFAALELWPVWAFRYFPSQDGPAHLYNASVLAWYADWPLVREYFDVRFPVAGNLASHTALGLLIPFVGPQTAEKLLLSAIILLFPVSAWLAAGAFGAPSREFALWGFLLGRGALFYLGFWNFCLAAGALLLLPALAARWEARPGRGVAAGIALLSGALYLCHSIAWAVAVAGALAVWAWSLGPGRRRGDEDALARRLRRLAPAAAAAVWPALLLAIYVVTTERLGAGPVMPPRDNAWSFYSGAFLGLIPGLMPVRWLAMGFAASMGAVALILRLRRRDGPAPSDSLLILAGLLALFMAFLPSHVGSAGFLTMRFALMTGVVLFAWLACQPWPGWARTLSVACSLAAAVLHARAGSIESQRWQDVLAELASLRDEIPAGSVVLPAQANRVRPAYTDPLVHAAGYWAPKEFVYLRNYEAFTPHFPVRFQAGRSPSRTLGLVRELEAAPARVSIARYESQRGGRVSHVVVYGAFAERVLADLPQQAWDPQGAFELVAVSRPRGHAYVYRRR